MGKSRNFMVSPVQNHLQQWQFIVFLAGKSQVEYDSMTPSHPIYEHRNVASRATTARFTGHDAGNSEESFWRTPKTADVHLRRLYALGYDHH